MNLIRRICAAFCLVWLAACSSSNQLNIYQLSHTQLAEQVQQQLQSALKPQRLGGMPVTFMSQHVETNIDELGVTLAITSNVAIDFGLVRVPLEFKVAAMVKPEVDNEIHGIRLTNFRLLDAEVRGGGVHGKLKPLASDLQHLLAQVIEQQPVFVLDRQDPLQRVLREVPLQLRLQPGQITLTPAYGLTDHK